MLIRRTDLARFHRLEAAYKRLPEDTRSRVTFERFCDAQDDLEEAKARTREQMAAADTHSSDVSPDYVDPWEER